MVSGKVSIRKEELCKFSGKEHWFGLQPVDPNSEVQVGVSQTVFRHLYVYPVGLGGKVHLQVIVLVPICGHLANIRLSNGIDSSWSPVRHLAWSNCVTAADTSTSHPVVVFSLS